MTIHIAKKLSGPYETGKETVLSLNPSALFMKGISVTLIMAVKLCTNYKCFRSQPLHFTYTSKTSRTLGI